MTFGPAFYEPFWAEFQSSYPKLPTMDGFRLTANDLTHNWIGHMVHVDGVGNIYIAMVFKGTQNKRPLVVEAYFVDGLNTNWQQLKATLQEGPLGSGSASSFPVVNIPVRPNAKGDRVCWEVYKTITASQAHQDQKVVHAQLAEAYKALLDRLARL